MTFTSVHLTAVGIALLTVIAAMVLLQERRMPQSTLAWLLAIMVLPYVAAPLFLMLGTRKFVRRRPHVPCDDAEAVIDAPGTFRALGSSRLRSGNSLRLVDTPQTAWAALQRLVGEAEESLDASYYIVSNDAEGRAFLRRLAERAAQGVRVRLTLDRLGCFFPPQAELRRLRRAGGELRWHAPLINRWSRGGLNLRNHRKVLIADGKRLMTGGMNIGGDYMRAAAGGGERGRELGQKTAGRRAGEPTDGLAAAPGRGPAGEAAGGEAVERANAKANELADGLVRELAGGKAGEPAGGVTAEQADAEAGERAGGTADELAGEQLGAGSDAEAREPADGPAGGRGRPRRPPFDDLNLWLEGPAVQDFRRLFEADWHAAGRTRLWHRAPTAPPPEPPELPPTGTAQVQLVASGPDRPLDALHKGLVTAVHRADRRVWLASPYFLPTGELILALAVAGRRGVDVRLLVPARSNHPTADMAGGSALRFLQGEGCRILRAEAMVHAKTGVVDDLGWIGTANIDLRSLLLNFETALMLYDPDSVGRLAAWFEHRFAHATEGVPRVGLPRRFGEGVFRLGAPLL